MTEFLSYALFRIFLAPFRVLPLRWVRRLGGFLGLTMYYFVPVRKTVIRRNIGIVFPEADETDVHRLVREAYCGFGVAVADFAFGTTFNSRNVYRCVRCEGLEHYWAAHEAGTQVILYTNHQAMWEWCKCVTQWGNGEKIYGIAKRIHNRYLDCFVDRMRGVFGAEIISQRGTVEQIRALRKNAPSANLAFLVDQRAGRNKGVWIDVCVQPVTRHARAGNHCSRRSSRRSHPTRADRSGMTMRFHEPIPFEPTGDRDADVQRLTQMMNDRVVDWIREQPESYFWLYNRSKIHPSEQETAERIRGERRLEPTSEGSRRSWTA